VDRCVYEFRLLPFREGVMDPADIYDAIRDALIAELERAELEKSQKVSQ
jgi:hypothetical protein